MALATAAGFVLGQLADLPLRTCRPVAGVVLAALLLLAIALEADPLRSAARPRSSSPEDAEQLAWLFTRFEASHALLIRTRPLRILVLNRPAIGGAELADLELRALQRMAALLSARS